MFDRQYNFFGGRFMACFLAPVAEAIIVSAVQIGLKQKEKKEAKKQLTNELETKKKNSQFSKKLGWLNIMLWGGSFLLAIEHIWHGEIVAYPPFLTAMTNPADTHAMLMEIATVGVTMAILLTAVWGIMVALSYYFEKKRNNLQSVAKMEE